MTKLFDVIIDDPFLMLKKYCADVTQDSKAFTQTPVERDLNRGKGREAF